MISRRRFSKNIWILLASISCCKGFIFNQRKYNNHLWPLATNLTPKELWETIFEKFDRIMGIWGESLSAMTWIEAVTLEKICYKKELGKYRVKRKCRDIFCPPFLPCLHTPQLLTFGRLQNTDFCSWGSRVKIRQYSNLERDTFVSKLIIGHIWVFFFWVS